MYVPSWHGWRVQKEIYKKLNSVVLKDNLQEEIRKDLQEFKNSRERYDYLNIPYNRGYLFYGPPGNGKTSISTALSSEFGMDLYYFNLSSMHDKEAIQIFNEIGGNTIILFEDIDSFYKGRECTEATKVSFSTLLNLIDGTLSKEGCIVIITTNHIEKLDPALIRTGRIHKKYYIDNPDTHQIESYLNKFFNQKIEIGKLIEQVSMSDVVNHCIETNDVSEVLHRISK